VRHTIRSIFALLVIVALLIPIAGLAQPSSGPAQQSRGRLPQRQRPDFSGIQVQRPPHLNRAAPSGSTSVVIELADEPTTVLFARASAGGQSLQSATSAAQSQLARIERAQQQLLAPLARLGARVLYRNQRVYNGIATLVDRGKLGELAQLPGVKTIRPLIAKQLDLSSSVPLIGAPQLWNSGGPNLTGQGIKIGIIDTGIDYIHTGFRGSGLQADYDRNNTKVITETPSLFPTAKVAGGRDFVGDDYDGSNIPQPDPDPMDCNGHGSHVAGIAAGNGVNANGTAYTGPYSSTLNFDNFRVGPGVAPRATLYALRVFGCDGSTIVTDQAIEWAVDPNGDGNFSDRLHVINMSLGSPFGGDDDTTAIASNNAVLAGVIVVTSAGNEGDTNYVTGSPGTATRVLSTASSVDATDILDGFRVNSPPSIDGVKPAAESALFDWENSTPVTGTLVYPPTQRDGCAAFTPANTAIITGNIVLLDWTDGSCGSVTRGANVVAAGGKGFLLVDNSDVFDLSINGSPVIPSYSTPKSVGDELKSVLPGSISVTLSHEYAHSIKFTDQRIVDTVSDFSSRGPSRTGTALKPDISAPGQGTFSVGALSGNEGANISGTSMASPHVAGSMALLKQLHPTWTVEELKALAMNTATQNLRQALTVDSGAPTVSPARQGAGRVDLVNAGSDTVVAYNTNTPGAVSVSFGAVEVLGTATATRQIRVVNKGASSATYNVAYAPAATVPGVKYNVAPANVTLAAGAVTTVTVTMNATAADMRHSHDPSLLEEQLGLSRHWLSEASGYVTLTPPAATRNFKADIRGDFENPPVESTVTGSAVFTYTDSTNELEYLINFSSPFSPTLAHVHRGEAGINGPIANPITVTNNITQVGGSVTLTAPDEALLLNGGLYVNFHTTAHGTGEIRGQIVAAQPKLRVPVHAAARPASNMHAQQTSLPFSRTALTGSTVVTLTGQTVNTGVNTPLDEQALVTALEWAASSANEPASPARADNADLRYVGIASDVKATDFFTETAVYFGVATYGDWATPNAVEFDIYIDTNKDGVDDFVLFNYDLSRAGGGDPTDVLVTVLCPLGPGGCSAQDFLNGLDAGSINTVPYNTNVMVLPVFAADLGLTAANSTFNYQIVSFSYALQDAEENLEVVDVSPWLSYNAGKPGLDLSDGVPGSPIYDDGPGDTIPAIYERAAFAAAGSRGLLLFHHHNRTGTRVDALALNVRVLYLPIIRKTSP
jgi:subtilisin family serine protease